MNSISSSRLILIFFCVLVFGSSYYFSRRTMPFELVNILSEDHPVRKSYIEYQKRFGDDNNFSIIVSSLQKPFTSIEVYQLSKKISTHLYSVVGIHHVETFSGVEYLEFNSNGFRLKPISDRGLMSDRQKN